MLFEQSFASSDKARHWSSKNIEDPRDIAKSSHNKFIFDCNVCFHEFTSALNNITNMKSWCPYCSGNKLCVNDCKTCFGKSFASSDRAEYWSSKNIEKPRNVFLNCNTKFWFNCIECSHEFDISPNSITNMKSWCPYCSGSKLCEDNVFCVIKGHLQVPKKLDIGQIKILKSLELYF
jgi:DNA-directed RNA polymerase subunit RPC12/RpoP